VDKAAEDIDQQSTMAMRIAMNVRYNGENKTQF
jgi:hypothetical protein